MRINSLLVCLHCVNREFRFELQCETRVSSDMNVYVDNRKCCVESCENTGRNCKLRFFMVPRDSVKAEKWLSTLKFKPNLPKKKYVCSDHFELKCFSSSLKRKLISSAVPTLQKKVPAEQGITLEQSMETHFVWNHMKTHEANSKNSSETQSASGDMSIDDKSSNSNVNKVKKLDFEKTLNEYLNRRYLTANQQENQKSLTDNVTYLKTSPSVLTENSFKENCNFLGQVTSQQMTAVCKISSDRNYSVKSKLNIKSRKMTTVPYDQPDFVPSPCASDVQLNFNESFTPHVTKNSKIHNNNNLIEESISERSKPAQTISDDICRLESSEDYNSFATSVVQRFKKLQNPSARAKAQINIEQILCDAESGFYDS